MCDMFACPWPSANGMTESEFELVRLTLDKEPDN